MECTTVTTTANPRRVTRRWPGLSLAGVVLATVVTLLPGAAADAGANLDPRIRDGGALGR